MKIIILIFTLLLVFQVSVKAELPESTMREIEAFAKKPLQKTDFEELKKTLNTLVVLDEEDPSRTAVLVLSESYEKNKALYEKALKAIETKKNKTQLKEIKYILKTHYIHGNG